METPEQVYERSPWRTNTSYADLQHGSDEYRTIRENFVSGFNGGSLFEIWLVIFLPPTTIVFNMAVVSYLQTASKWFKHTRRGQLGDSPPKNLSLFEYFVNVWLDTSIVFLPQIYAGFYPHHWIYIYWAISICWVILHFLNKEAVMLPLQSNLKAWYKVGENKFHNALSGIIKTNVMVPTVIYIFAVDFHDFPRRFWKSTDYGLSVMDVGTGFLISLMGAVASLKTIDSKSILSRFIGVLKTIPIIMTIAVGGFFSRWFTNHPEVVTEYGVHWNFFWTIAWVAILASFIPTTKLLFAQTLAVLLFYQLLLNVWGTDFILNAPRENFFSQNREGILGWIGYLGLYMLGLCISKYLFKSTEVGKTNWNNHTVREALFPLFMFLLVAALAMFACIEWVQEISRRTVNLSYIISIFAGTLFAYINGAFLLTTLKRTQFVYSVSIITGNQFIFFMVCNILMSIYNIWMMTTFHPNWVAIPVIYIYSVLAITLTDILTRYGVKVK